MKHAVYGLALLTLSGCGTFKKVFKSHNELKRSTQTAINTKHDTVKVIIDKSVTAENVVTETTKVTAVNKHLTGQTNLKAISALDELTKGLTLILDSGLGKANLALDTLQNVLKLEVETKAKDSVHTKRSEARVIKADKRDSAAGHTVTAMQQKEAIKTENTVIKKQPKNGFWLVVLIVSGAVLLGAIVIFIIRKVKDKWV